jgi:hypothetical protein
MEHASLNIVKRGASEETIWARLKHSMTRCTTEGTEGLAIYQALCPAISTIRAASITTDVSIATKQPIGARESSLCVVSTSVPFREKRTVRCRRRQENLNISRDSASFRKH